MEPMGTNAMRVILFLLIAGFPIWTGCASDPLLAGAAAAGAAPDAATRTVAIVQPRGMTLPEFLGVCQVVQGSQKVCGRVRNRLGNRFPGLEQKPSLLALNDPANMGEDAPPAVQAAAEIKAEEDKADQKIKALNYLADIGCTKCYPDAEKAFLSALDDCTEAVRFASVKGLRKTTGGPCSCCVTESCCTKDIYEKLTKITSERDCNGCYAEPSERVRRNARLALAGCNGPILSEPEDEDEEAPAEGPANKSKEKEGSGAKKQTDAEEEPTKTSKSDSEPDSTKAAQAKAALLNSGKLGFPISSEFSTFC